MANTENLQDLILNEVRREHTAVTMFLMNGFQLKGIVTGFDNFVVGLSSDGKQQMKMCIRDSGKGPFSAARRASAAARPRCARPPAAP